MLANVYKVNLPVPFSNLSSSKLVNNEYDCIEFSVLLLIGISTFPLFIISLHLARLDTLPVRSPTLRKCQLWSILLASWAIIWYTWLLALYTSLAARSSALSQEGEGHFPYKSLFSFEYWDPYLEETELFYLMTFLLLAMHGQEVSCSSIRGMPKIHHPRSSCGCVWLNMLWMVTRVCDLCVQEWFHVVCGISLCVHCVCEWCIMCGLCYVVECVYDLCVWVMCGDGMFYVVKCVCDLCV